MTWAPTREAALARLASFLPHAGRRYADRRNFDTGPGLRQDVSQLSPWLRRRVLTEQEVAGAAIARHGLEACQKFVQEVAWRTYWKGWLETRAGLWRSTLDEVARAHRELEVDRSLTRRYDEATLGRTGLSHFDAWARELCETGYLHNHARMWFASIWCFTLELPWCLGADHFYRHLLDGDPASNTLSWRWVVGLHTPGKTYLATEGNIARFTEGRFDEPPRLALAREARALPGSPNPRGGKLPESEALPRGRFALLLTEEDLSPLEADPRLADAVTVAGVLASDLRSSWGASPRVAAFEAGVVDDALHRISVATGAPSAGVLPFTAEALHEWARSAGAEWIVTAYPPVGPVADRLSELGLPLVRRLAPWDLSLWPHAQRGFFALGSELPRLLPPLVQTRA